MDKQSSHLYTPRAEQVPQGSEDDFAGGSNDGQFSRGVGFTYTGRQMGGAGPTNDSASAAGDKGRRSTFLSGLRHSLAGGGGNHGDGEKEAPMDTYEAREKPGQEKGGTGGEGNMAIGSHEHVEDLAVTKSRRCWVFFTWILTFWMPSPLLTWCGRMKRQDVRMAWREKLAICVIIVILWFALLFLIIGLGLILCPKENVWTLDDIAGYNTEDKAYVALRGSTYDITDWMKQPHGTTANKARKDLILEFYAGNDVNASFPIPVRVACPQFLSAEDDPNYTRYYPVDGASDNTDTTGQYMFKHKYQGDPTSDELKDPNFFAKYALPALKKFKKGGVVWKFDWIDSMYKEQGKYWRVINKEVFNMQPYFDPIINGAFNTNNKYNLLDSKLEAIMNQDGYGSADITKDWDALTWNPATREANYNCMKNLFYVGRVDDRQSVRCHFANYMLLAFAALLMVVVLAKFLAALQFGNKKRPIPPHKFVVCQVPCYTEDEDSLSKTIQSLAGLEYEDNHKLLLVICDGNIVGSGNEKSTPRIVLDILGVDPEYDPPGRDYLAIAEGSRRHNICKVYSGLYEFEGHVVPFMVVVKVGTPDETSRSGNRGKRDSQLVAMSFFNKVHFDLPMTPLELEMYHQMRHIIGVPPQNFEYLLQVDADTEVMPDSLTRLVSACSSDQRIAGICGETMLGNESKSWTTMMQVYEYFISHHMAKAFESLFGSVTCLPGCFCLYRLRNPAGKPLLIAKPVLEAYSELHVDTLHKKNLLSLGEDRYLTTLMMKNFPQFKLKFIQDAKCKTIAPEKWGVLMSQRRRWINSTVHNLAELLFLPNLCGFCCFSMRFVVFLDLFGTLTMPTTLGYFIYLIYAAATNTADVGYISLYLIAAIYGVQMVIFVLRREWQHIGWMIIYLLAFPLWSCVLPIYSFWHMDDFSWGNTRVVVGDGKRKIIINDDKPFDPKSIPQRRWIEYEGELAAAGVLNAPPPNMNPNAGSSKEDDRGTMYSRQSGPNGSQIGYQMPPAMSMPRVGTPTTMYGGGPGSVVMGGPGSVMMGGPGSVVGGGGDPRLTLSTPVALQQQQQHYNMRANSPSDMIMMQPMDTNSMMSRTPSYYQNSQAGIYNTYTSYGNTSPTPSSSGLLANTGAVRPISGVPSGGFFNQQPMQQQQSMPPAAASHPEHTKSIYSTSSAGGPASAFAPMVASSQAMMSGGTPGMMMSGLLPTDDQLVESIRRILANSDLNAVTKKSVRTQLSAEYGVDLSPRKDFIGDAIELILAGQL